MNPSLPTRCVRGLCVVVLLGLASMAPARADFNDCPTFDSCTAGLLSQAAAGARYTTPIVAISSDSHEATTRVPVSASVGDCAGGPCGGSAPYANAAAQTDFGINRAVSRTGPGFPIGGRAVQTLATATSNWHDVLSFSGSGSAHADVSVDGTVGVGQGGGPSYLGSGWDYALRIFDLSDLVADVEGTLVPRVVAEVSTGASLSSPSFAASLVIDFDFLAGDRYFIDSSLSSGGHDGGFADVYNTVRMGSWRLSEGVSLSTLSGHDYTTAMAPVPEPEIWGSMLAGGLALLGVSRRRRPPMP